MPSYIDRSLNINQGRQRVCDGDIQSNRDNAISDAKLEAFRRSVLQLNLISVVDVSTLISCEQNVLCEAMNKNLLFAKIAEPEMKHVNFNHRFCDRMG